jgi:hypothetical protein
MAHAIRGIFDARECALDLLQLEIGALFHEVLNRHIAFAGSQVEDVGGKFGSCRWRPTGRGLEQKCALTMEQLPANGSECTVT